ncbi:acetylornithine deacetylase [Raoultella terrigena]|uniref:Acetylornithine deacetylase n=1 Tax=Raoultella terrigena TaxID=577 RepID=A0A4U9D7E9_RAOTE|nr:acetylornithine deacetylase [Raoultella terrigena]
MNSDLKRILATLLAFDTTSRESNLQLINYIDEYLRGLALPRGFSLMRKAKKPTSTPALARRGRGA